MQMHASAQMPKNAHTNKNTQACTSCIWAYDRHSVDRAAYDNDTRSPSHIISQTYIKHTHTCYSHTQNALAHIHNTHRQMYACAIVAAAAEKLSRKMVAVRNWGGSTAKRQQQQQQHQHQVKYGVYSYMKLFFFVLWCYTYKKHILFVMCVSILKF